MVTWSYNNITIFHLIFNVSDELHRMTLMSEVIQKYFIYIYIYL